MKLDNHIAYRFLTDDTLVWDWIEGFHKKEYDKMIEVEDKEDLENVEGYDDVRSTWNFLRKESQKAYWITHTVIDKLDMLKTSKKDGKYDWTYFDSLQDQKITFIFPDNCVLRLMVTGDQLLFCHLDFNFDKNSNSEGITNWVMFYVNRKTGEQCDHFNHIDVRKIEEFVYRLMIFFFLTDNEYTVVEPGMKHGTRKTGKIINILPIPITVVNNNWNITSIRTEGFGVKGHFAVRWCGPGRKIPRVLFIEPFRKHGYVRKAQNHLIK